MLYISFPWSFTAWAVNALAVSHYLRDAWNCSPKAAIASLTHSHHNTISLSQRQIVCSRLGRPVRLIMAMFSITNGVSVTVPTWTLFMNGTVYVLVDWPSQWSNATQSFRAVQPCNWWHSQYPSKLAVALWCNPMKLLGFLSVESRFI